MSPIHALSFPIFALVAALSDAPPAPPPGPPRPPPPEAFTACDAKAKGDACSVTFHDKTIAGTCTTPPPNATETRLFCMPEGFPLPPDR